MRFLEINEIWEWCDQHQIALEDRARPADDVLLVNRGRWLYGDGGPSGREASVAVDHARWRVAIGRRLALRGPFAGFEHDHFFIADAGGTLVRDVFDFRAPWGPLGWIAERLFLAGYMRGFLGARLQSLKELAESSGWRAFVDAEAAEAR